MAQNNLGLMYYYGYGVQKNYKKAYEWLEKAVKQGYEPSKQMLKELFQKHNKN